MSENTWFESELRTRLRRYHCPELGLPISIKLRSKDRQCMDKCCWPNVHDEIDRLIHEVDHHLQQQEIRGPRQWHFERHETGPEIIAYIGNGLTLAAGVITLTLALVDLYSRHQSRRNGKAELELTIRGFGWDDKVFDEILSDITINYGLSNKELEEAIANAIKPHCIKPFEAKTISKPRKKDSPKKATKTAARKRAPKKK